MSNSNHFTSRPRFADQVVLVVGAGSGIGRAAAMLFAREGARVALADISSDKARETEALILKEHQDSATRVLSLDVTNVSQWESVLSEVTSAWRRVDVMVQSAGIADDAPLVDLKAEQWRRVLSVNLDGAWLGTSVMMRHMFTLGTGSIVHVASLTGVKAMPGAAAYGVSKAGLIHLSKVAALECAQAGHRIRVNCVVPGGVRTPMWESTPMWPALRESEEWQAGPETPALKRFAEPEEIARAILFLASSDASYVNGEALMVDGGGGI